MGEESSESVHVTERTQISLPVFAQFLAWIVAALFIYGAVNARVSVVESKQSETERRLNSIESKIDVLLSRGK